MEWYWLIWGQVIRIDRLSNFRTGNKLDFKVDLNYPLSADLKDPKTIEEIKKLIISADAIIEGFRPGVMERLGLGPDDLLDINPGLVYGRMTGWGQDGH